MGSSGTYPVPGRPASGYMIEQGTTRVWCEAGHGTFMAFPVDSDLIDAIAISHSHADHCADLFAAFHAWRYRPEPRSGVPLYAPQDLWDRVWAFVDRGQNPHLDSVFDFYPVGTGDTVTIGEITVSFADTDHSVASIGSRWEANGRSLFFTGDTGPVGDWRALARGVDLMLAEATYQGERSEEVYPHHLTAAEAAQIAREVGAKKLVLTHIPPYLDPARSVHEAEVVFDRPVGLAVPGTTFDV